MLVLVVGVTSSAYCEEEVPDVAGLWRFHLSSGDQRKDVTMKFTQDGTRLEGWLYDAARGHPKIQGKVKSNKKIIVWTRFEDRTGASQESTFRGKLEGDTITGKVYLWRKSWEFVAEPVKEE